MPQCLAEELAQTMLAALGEALDLVDCGFMLLDQDMQVRFISETFAQLTGIERRFSGDVWLRDLFGPHWEAEIRCRSEAGLMLNLPDARHLAIGCRATSEGYLLSCSRLSALAIEPQPALPGEEDRLCADLRFDKEVLEDQAAHLASLAEESDANARRAEQAKRELEHEIVRRRQLEAELQRLATTDPLTGALNRRQIFALGRQALRLRRSKQAFGLLMVDIDHFKMINDRHGHPVGDAALKHVVHCLRAGLRQTDLIGRVGGEEFAIMLPTTTIDDALRVAERLRTRVATKPLKQGSTTICMTISIGLAMARQTDHSLEQIIARADTQLYRAKEGGRDRVCHDENPSGGSSADPSAESRTVGQGKSCAAAGMRGSQPHSPSASAQRF
jgi:diguanylate cyclase (GGDEF)-like protein